jgi:hypothetical protein
MRDDRVLREGHGGAVSPRVPPDGEDLGFIENARTGTVHILPWDDTPAEKIEGGIAPASLKGRNRNAEQARDAHSPHAEAEAVIRPAHAATGTFTPRWTTVPGLPRSNRTGGRMSQAGEARVTGSDDAAGMQGIAARLEVDNPSWIVLFGGYTREFVAFPRFDVPGGAVITARNPDALPPRMLTVEAMARLAITGRAPGTQPEDTATVTFQLAGRAAIP